MAFTAVASVLAGTASTAVVIAAIGEVGLALTVAGAVTGNKNLMKVGAVMGVAGGVGSLATSAFGAATEGAAAIAGDSAVNAGLSAGETGAMDMGIGAAAEGGSAIASDIGSGIANSSGAMADGGGEIAGIDQISGDQTMQPNVGGGSGVDAPKMPEDSPSNSPFNSSTPASETNSLSPAYDSGNHFSDAGHAAQTGIDNSYVGSGTAETANKSLNGSSYFNKLSNYLTSDKGMNTSLQLGAGALSGIGKAYSDNRNNQLNQQALDLKKQAAVNANDQVRVAGIINKARAA